MLVLCQACAKPKLIGVCREDGVIRECNRKEQRMIDGMHTIIRAVYNFDELALKGRFLVSDDSRQNPRVLFFGEAHTKIIGQMETLGAINMLAKKGDQVLLEGNHRNTLVGECGLELVFRIYRDWQLEKLGQPYEGDGAWKLAEREKLREVLESTRESYDLTGLNIAHLKCGFWDDNAGIRDALKRGVTYANTKKRNKSMRDAISEGLLSAGQVFINTGFAHMPTGDLLKNRLRNIANVANFPKTLPQFYSLAKAERRLPGSSSPLKLSKEAGSSAVIYKYLKNNGISYGEYIHHDMYQ